MKAAAEGSQAFLCRPDKDVYKRQATSSDKMRVLSVAIATLQGQHGTEYHLLMAAGVMATIPMVLMYMIGQKYFMTGIAFAGVKG